MHLFIYFAVSVRLSFEKWINLYPFITIQNLWEKTVKEDSRFGNSLKLKKAMSVSTESKITMEAPMIMPLKKYNGSTVIWFLLEHVRENQEISVPPNEQRSVNAFSLIIAKTVSPLSLKETKNRKDELYNDVVTVTHAMKLKFSKSEENILKIIKNVCNALWMIDRNHEKFNTAFAQDHCSKLAQLFSNIYNKSYND